MEVSDYLHAPTALSSRRNSIVQIE